MEFSCLFLLDFSSYIFGCFTVELAKGLFSDLIKDYVAELLNLSPLLLSISQGNGMGMGRSI